ncbi:MAG: homoserine dehydrogenase [Bacillota bacterium]|nr:homoserine dehydrogenase [Bacillota bacterium]
MRIGFLGLGTVGQAVVRLLHEEGERLGAAGWALEPVRALVRDAARPRAVPVDLDLTADPARVVEDPAIDLVVEVMGGVEPATSYMLRALRAGKPVVTANKEAIAHRGKDLLEAAAEVGVPLRFEACVAAAIPIVRALKDSLAGDRITEIAGIVNGTSNYVLGLMEQGCDLKVAVRMAQERGYAEPDPTRDLDGSDAACKLAILASIAFSARVRPEQVGTHGIQMVSREDLRWGREMGYRLKLLALARRAEAGIEAHVRPTFLPVSHPLAGVGGVTNALLVRGERCGDLVFQGPGAGGDATATAVVGDMLEIARRAAVGARDGAYCTCREQVEVVPPRRCVTGAYLHLEVADRPGVLAQVAGCLAAHQVSIAEALQKARGEGPVPVLFITHASPWGPLEAAVEEIGRLPVVAQVAGLMAVLGR